MVLGKVVTFVAKQRKRYVRKKKHRVPASSVCDMHHLCWMRKRWGGDAARKFRYHPYCVVAIPKVTLHHYIHQKMSHIPVPTERVLREALMVLDAKRATGEIRMDDPIEQRLRVLATIFMNTAPETTEAFRQQLKIVREFNKKAPP